MRGFRTGFRRFLKRWRFLGYTILAVAIIFGVLEIVARTFLHFDEVAAEGGFPVNGDGYRDRPHVEEKAAGTFRVLCVGDSTTYGHGLPYEDSYPAMLEARLNNEGGGSYETILVAAKGWNTEQKSDGFKRALRYGPDLLLYQYELNDINWDFRSRSSSRLIRRIDQHLLSSIQFYSSLKMSYWLMVSSDQMFDSLKQSYTDENPEWRETITRLGEIASTCREKGITPVFFSPPILLDQEGAITQLDKLLDMAGKQAERAGFVYLPLHRQLKPRPARDYRVYIFDLHPNRRCNEATVDYMVRFLRDNGYLPPVGADREAQDSPAPPSPSGENSVAD